MAKPTQPKRKSGPVAPSNETMPKKPAANKAQPPKPAKKRDEKDIDRADSEGMAQPQGRPAKSKSTPVAPTPAVAKRAGKKR